MKTKFLEALTPKEAEHDVDGYGPLRLRELSIGEVDAIRDAVKAIGENASASEFGLRMLVASALDENGQRLLGDEDLEALRGKSSQRINAILRKVLEVNGVPTSQAGVATAKNASAPTPAGASASD